jgi:hypothetical protein
MFFPVFRARNVLIRIGSCTNGFTDTNPAFFFNGLPDAKNPLTLSKITSYLEDVGAHNYD